jgi:hypothetical protein
MKEGVGRSQAKPVANLTQKHQRAVDVLLVNKSGVEEFAQVKQIEGIHPLNR